MRFVSEIFPPKKNRFLFNFIRFIYLLFYWIKAPFYLSKELIRFSIHFTVFRKRENRKSKENVTKKEKRNAFLSFVDKKVKYKLNQYCIIIHNVSSMKSSIRQSHEQTIFDAHLYVLRTQICEAAFYHRRFWYISIIFNLYIKLHRNIDIFLDEFIHSIFFLSHDIKLFEIKKHKLWYPKQNKLV